MTKIQTALRTLVERGWKPQANAWINILLLDPTTALPVAFNLCWPSLYGGTDDSYSVETGRLRQIDGSEWFNISMRGKDRVEWLEVSSKEYDSFVETLEQK